SARSPNSRLMRMCGVLPIVSRMFDAFIRCIPSLAGDRGIRIVRFETFCKPQLREPPRPQEDNPESADPAGDHRGDGTDQRAQKPGFRLPKLVRGRNEEGRDRPYAATHLIGGM